MLYMGIYYLLTLFQRVWVTDGEVQLRIGKLVLFRLPEERITAVRFGDAEIPLTYEE